MLRKPFFTVVLGLLVMSGCNKSNLPETIVNVPPASTSTATPAVEPVATKPEWAEAFLKGLELIGEPKEKVAKELGDPGEVVRSEDTVGGDTYTKFYFYRFENNSKELFVHFNIKGTVSDIKVRVSEGVNTMVRTPTMSEIWSVLSDNDAPPLYYMLSDQEARDYWKMEDPRLTSYEPIPFAVVGYAKGRLIQLMGDIYEPPLKGDKTFNTSTDTYEVGELYPNPNTSWGDAKVITVLSDPVLFYDTAFRNEYTFRKGYGDKHYISGKATSHLSQPASERVDADIMGLWQGSFSGDKADLQIDKREENSFWGTYTVHESKGDVKIAVQGVLSNDGVISFKETKVITIRAGYKWTLGANTGKFSDDKLSISGVGTDSKHPVYGWNFTKKE